MPLKVLHVSQPTDAGVAVCVRGLAADQKLRSWAVTVACPDGWLADEMSALGVDRETWRATRSLGPHLTRETLSLGKIVRDARPDVLHLHSSKAGLAGRLSVRKRTPTVFQPHAWSFLALAGVGAMMARKWELFAVRWADMIVCVSEAERELLAPKGEDDRFRVVPNGIDLEAWRLASDEDRARARADLGLDDRPIAVCVGRLARQKGQDIAIDIWPRVRERVPRAELILVGDGPARSTLQARGVSGVTFAGARSRVWPWLAAADVVVFPSRWEGMSLGMLEAMATGRSVVMHDVPGARESISPGAVVRIGDESRLVSALVERLSDPEMAREEGAALRAEAEAAHDLARSWDAIATLYREVAG